METKSFEHIYLFYHDERLVRVHVDWYGGWHFLALWQNTQKRFLFKLFIILLCLFSLFWVSNTANAYRLLLWGSNCSCWHQTCDRILQWLHLRATWRRCLMQPCAGCHCSCRTRSCKWLPDLQDQLWQEVDTAHLLRAEREARAARARQGLGRFGVNTYLWSDGRPAWPPVVQPGTLAQPVGRQWELKCFK
jgi:hypothetical protein